MPIKHHEYALAKHGDISLGEVMMGGRIVKQGGAMHPYRYLGAYALVLLVDGKGTYEDDLGRFAVVGPGSIICINPEVGHRYGPGEGETWEEVYLVFDGPLFDLWKEKGILGDQLWMLTVENPHLWCDRFQQQFDDPSADRMGQVMRLQLLLTELLKEQKEHALVNLSHPALRKSLALLANTNDTVAQIASAVGMGFESFRKQFKSEYGVSPHQYRQRQIYLKAWHLILGTDKSMAEIAGSLDFYDEHYFSRFFKKHNGLSPGQFREQRRTS